MMNLQRTTACFSLALLVAGGVWLARSAPVAAQEEELPRLTTEQIIEQLDTSRAGPPPGVRVRGLRPGGDAEAARPSSGAAATQPGAGVAAAQEGPGSGRVNMQVWFEYDSAELTPEARQDLARLGEALRSEQLADYAFVVAGHTDAAGSDAYNMELSRRRAESVANYLSERFGIDRSRLRSEGWGETRLYDPDQPQSGINRRVEIVNVGQATAARQQ